MVDHYYSANPAAAHRRQEFRYTFRGREYRFRTDAGVFSKGHLDRGTRLLMEAMDLDGVERALDLGCGYGVLGIVIPRNDGARVAMVDPNGRAVERPKHELNGWRLMSGKGGLCAFAGEKIDYISQSTYQAEKVVGWWIRLILGRALLA